MIKVNYNDIVGKTFNNLTVVKYLGLKKVTYKSSDTKIRTMNQAMYLCKCSCGNESYITDRYSLIRTDGKGNKSCGTCVQRDILGKTFGNLTVVEFVGYKKGTDAYYKCKCSCGGETESRRSHLLSGESKSCGFCVRNSIVGKKFNHITVLALAGYNKHGQQRVLCKCDCGNIYECDMQSVTRYKSCGKCFNVLPESYKETYHKNCVRLSWVYDSIYQRCNNAKLKSYYNYGGRGIRCRITKHDFIARYYRLDTFNLQVDRIDNEDDYFFENIRWVTNEENAKNKTYVYNLTYEQVASRLMPKDKHKGYTVNGCKFNIKEYYAIVFSELTSNRGTPLCLYVHVSLSKHINDFINQIKQNYKLGGIDNIDVSYIEKFYNSDDDSVLDLDDDLQKKIITINK